MRPRAAAAAALALLALSAACLAPTAAAAEESPEWEVYRSNLKSMRVAGSDQTLGERLGAFLDYKFTLPLNFMRRSQVRPLPHAHTHTQISHSRALVFVCTPGRPCCMHAGLNPPGGAGFGPSALLPLDLLLPPPCPPP